MKTAGHAEEILLKQGEVHFGDRNTCIRTVLGSCVAITMWHPKLLVGGMCHYVLPARLTRDEKMLDGKYADEALELMLQAVRTAGGRAYDYQVKSFGGGNMFSAINKPCKLGEQQVGKKNVRACRELLKQHGLNMDAEHLGGVGHRIVVFNILNGHVWMKQQPPLQSTCDKCLNKAICLLL